MIKNIDFEIYDDEYPDLEKDYLKHMKKIQNISTVIASNTSTEETPNDSEILDFNNKTEDIYGGIHSSYKIAYRRKDPSLMYAINLRLKHWIQYMDYLIQHYTLDHPDKYRKKKTTKPIKRIIKKCRCK